MAIWPSLHFLKCFSQPWEGDVTIVLPSSYMQIKKSITNPTSDDLLQACQQVRPPPPFHHPHPSPPFTDLVSHIFRYGLWRGFSDGRQDRHPSVWIFQGSWTHQNCFEN